MNNNLGPDTAFCAGDSLVLGDPNNSGNILWSTGATSPTIKVHDAGIYWVNITGSSCQTGSDTIKITLNPLPVVEIDKNDTTICSGTFPKLNGLGAQTYSWEPANLVENPTQASITVNPNVTTTYYLNGKDQNGCGNQDSVTIKVKQAPNVKITAATTEVSCSQQTIQLNASGAYSYLWSPGMY